MAVRKPDSWGNCRNFSCNSMPVMDGSRMLRRAKSNEWLLLSISSRASIPLPYVVREKSGSRPKISGNNDVTKEQKMAFLMWNAEEMINSVVHFDVLIFWQNFLP